VGLSGPLILLLFSLAHGTTDCGTSRLAPWNPSLLGDFDMFLASGYVKIAIEMAIDIVTIVDFPIENGDFP